MVEAELPGVKKEDIHLEIDDGQLLISVEQKDEVVDENKKYLHRERRYSSTQRRLNLGNASPEGVTAKLDDGLLKIRIQKEENKGKPNQIEIQ